MQSWIFYYLNVNNVVNMYGTRIVTSFLILVTLVSRINFLLFVFWGYFTGICSEVLRIISNWNNSTTVWVIKKKTRENGKTISLSLSFHQILYHPLHRCELSAMAHSNWARMVLNFFSAPATNFYVIIPMEFIPPQICRNY